MQHISKIIKYISIGYIASPIICVPTIYFLQNMSGSFFRGSHLIRNTTNGQIDLEDYINVENEHNCDTKIVYKYHKTPYEQNMINFGAFHSEPLILALIGFPIYFPLLLSGYSELILFSFRHLKTNIPLFFKHINSVNKDSYYIEINKKYSDNY